MSEKESKFRNLQAYFKVTRRRFEKAKTFEEKRELLAISREIIREAHRQIAESRAHRASSKRLLATLTHSGRSAKHSNPARHPFG